MNRRDLLKLVTLATGGAIIGGEFLLSSCNNPDTASTITVLSPDDISFLDEVGETIIPTTGSPGAKAARVGDFMQIMIRDCYEEDDRQTFRNGIGQLDKACKDMHGSSFLNASAGQRETLLIALDKEAKEHQKKKSAFDDQQNSLARKAEAEKNDLFKKEKMAPHYFTMMKQLTMIGFFTSKIGATQALRHVAVPGRYDGDLDYKPGDKAWSSK